MTQSTLAQPFNPADPALGRTIARQFLMFCRTMLHGPAVEKSDSHCLLRTGEPHPFGNFAVFETDVTPAQAMPPMQKLIDDNAPAALIFTGGTNAEIESLCAEHNFVLAETMPAMALDLSKLTCPQLAAGYTFHEIEPPADHEAWSEAMAVGYEIPLSVGRLLGPKGKSRDNMRYFAIAHDGRFVTTSIMWLEHGYAGIYAVATRPEARGKGLGAYVTAKPLQLAREAGYNVGVLQASEMGEPVYRRLGFQSLAPMPLYVRMPS